MSFAVAAGFFMMPAPCGIFPAGFFLGTTFLPPAPFSSLWLSLLPSSSWAVCSAFLCSERVSQGGNIASVCIFGVRGSLALAAGLARSPCAVSALGGEDCCALAATSWSASCGLGVVHRNLRLLLLRLRMGILCVCRQHLCHAGEETRWVP